MRWWSTLALGFALFSMFFGAGNLVFPLQLGEITGNQTLISVIGLCITAVFFPLLGLYATVLYDGKYKDFFYRIGRGPGFLLLLIIHLTLGPFGSIARLFTLAHATIHPYLDLSLPLFSLLAATVVFFLSIRKNRLVDLLGYGLTPILLLSLAAVIVIGLINHPPALVYEKSAATGFFVGLRKGYDMLDLIAAFLFAKLILRKLHATTDNKKLIFRQFLKASMIASLLLGVIYAFLGLIAAYHAPALGGALPERMLSLISRQMLGPVGGLIAALAIAIACLTTAISLVALFAEFLQKDLCRGKIGETTSLIITLALSGMMACLGFGQIMRILGPVIETCYPIVIVLTIVNVVIKTRERRRAINLG